MRANVLTMDSPGLRPPPLRGGRPHPDPLLEEREMDGREGWDL